VIIFGVVFGVNGDWKNFGSLKVWLTFSDHRKTAIGAEKLFFVYFSIIENDNLMNK
jgi:hypothetical protein